MRNFLEEKIKIQGVLLTGQFLAQLSDRIVTLGLIWMITSHFGAPKVTWYLVAGGVPHLLFSYFSGRVIQNIGTLNVVILTDFVRSIIFILSAFFIFDIQTEYQLHQVFFLIFFINVCAVFFNTAIFSLPLDLEQGIGIQKLTARLSTVASMVSFVGPLIGIGLVQFLGLRGLFFSNVVCYALSAGCGFYLIKKLKIFDKKKVAEQRSPPFFHSLWSEPLVVHMLIVFLFINVFLSPLQVLIPARAAAEKSFNTLALLEASLGIGLLLGGLFFSVVSIRRKTLGAAFLFLGGASLSYIVFQFNISLFFAVLSLGGLGIFLGMANVLILNLFQTLAKYEHVPNIMSSVNLISVAALPVSLTLAGFLQNYFTIETLGWSSSFAVVFVLLYAFVPFRRYGRDLFL